jgi:ATP-dependent RNA helicase DDX24/MAK5
MRKGFSMLMCAPDERRVVKGLLSSLGRGESSLPIDDALEGDHSAGDTEIPEMPIELFMIDKLKARVHLARQIDLLQHKIQKEKHERNWMTETAEALELELDSDFVR